MVNLLKFCVAPLIFCILAWAVSHFFSPVESVEYISLFFFAAFAPITLFLDHADLVIQKEGRRGATFTYFVVDYAATLFFFSLLAGGLFATGGGVLRRGIELIVYHTFSLAGAPFKKCFLPDSLVWPIPHQNWSAVGYGIILGTISGLALTWTIRFDPTKGATFSTTVRSIFTKETNSVDGFATAFFSAFGMEAALRFISGLPLGSHETIPPTLQSAIHIVAFFILTPIVVLCFSGLTSCGGGVLKDIIIDGVLLRKMPIKTVICTWPWKRTTQSAAAIGLMAWVACQLLASHGQSLEACTAISPERMFQLVMICGLLGLVIWGTIFRTRAG